MSNDTEPEKEYTYATLMESNGEECESWYYFIRYQGNEEALKHLEDQLESIKEWYVLDDLSAFVLDLENLISERTAKEVTKLELNAISHHRKFDGKLKKISFPFRRRDKNDTKLLKIHEILGHGSIEDYVSDEDIDEEDLASSFSVSESDSESDSETKKDIEKELKDTENKNKPKGKIPANLRLKSKNNKK